MNRRTLLSSLFGLPFLRIIKPKNENIAIKQPKFKVGQRVTLIQCYPKYIDNIHKLTFIKRKVSGTIMEIFEFITNAITKNKIELSSHYYTYKIDIGQKVYSHCHEHEIKAI